MSADWPASPFWDFSLEIYRRPGVEAACLELQDQHRLDVNLVLLAAWLALGRRRLDAPLAARLRQLGDGWQARVMQPMREARRALQVPDPGHDLVGLRDQCRRAVLRVELDLERLEQLQLEQRAASVANDAASAPAMLLSANLGALYPDREVPPGLVAALAAQLAELLQEKPDARSSA